MYVWWGTNLGWIEFRGEIPLNPAVVERVPLLGDLSLAGKFSRQGLERTNSRYYCCYQIMPPIGSAQSND